MMGLLRNIENYYFLLAIDFGFIQRVCNDFENVSDLLLTKNDMECCVLLVFIIVTYNNKLLSRYLFSSLKPILICTICIAPSLRK